MDRRTFLLGLFGLLTAVLAFPRKTGEDDMKPTKGLKAYGKKASAAAVKNAPRPTPKVKTPKKPMSHR
ncbi:MAG: hypothetical protein M3O22_00355 [Pseudomonadota bacterium]|nr:hypothetical protein [Pseudomonadota bacterium]